MRVTQIFGLDKRSIIGTCGGISVWPRGPGPSRRTVVGVNRSVFILLSLLHYLREFPRWLNVHQGEAGSGAALRSGGSGRMRTGGERGGVSHTRTRLGVLRLGVLGVIGLLLANCSGGSFGSLDPRYGVSSSPRVVAPGDPVPKGGGTYRVGAPYVVGGKTYVPEDNPHYRA